MFKTKQDDTADQGHYQSDDESLRAQSSRRTNARKKSAHDPVLPEKKRARRRLIGALALVLAAVIVLPMVLDPEPKISADDISIQIPSKDKPLEQAVAANSASSRSVETLDVANDKVSGKSDQANSAVSTPSATVDKPALVSEKSLAPKHNSEAKTEPVEEILVGKDKFVPLDKAQIKPNSQISENKPAANSVQAQVTEKSRVKDDLKTAQKADLKPDLKAEHKAESKFETKAESKLAKESAHKPEIDETARALAILEGKELPVSKNEETKPSHYVVQVAALATQEKVSELQEKLKAGNIKSYTQKIATTTGDKIRIRIGPFASKEEAQKTIAKLKQIGLSGTLIPS